MRAFFLYILLLTIVFASCNSHSKKVVSPESGTIIYKVDILDSGVSEGSRNFLPNELHFIFRDNQVKHYLKGHFNIYSLSLISMSPQDSCVILFQFMDKCLIYSMYDKNCFFLYDQYKHAKINLDYSETKKITGFNCKKAQISYDNHEPVFVYYTTEIKLNNPNRYTPLSAIPGVLMEFPFEYNGIKLNVSAMQFDDDKPSSKEFLIPASVTQSSRSEVETMVQTLMDIF